ncbi:MAG: hypothetical protein ACKVTZ_23200 [Bacteroidia bacterium]
MQVFVIWDKHDKHTNTYLFVMIFQRLEQFVKDVFKTTVEVFFDALRLSPNAQGYVSGSITELLLKQYLQKQGFEVKRIREKWEGKKHSNHHGDFYFRKPKGKWFVLESKGVKSNSEKWHKLYNYEKLVRFLFDHNEKISWINPSKSIENQIVNWVEKNLPKFANEYAQPIYTYEEIQDHLTSGSTRQTKKALAIQNLKSLSRGEVNNMIDERISYVMSKVKVLETHFVSGTSGASERTQATPRKDEFNLISIDIFLRHTEHKFLFANPKQLDASGADANHLQQNYIMGFIFTQADNTLKIDLTDEWYENLEEAYLSINPEDAINEVDMQEDIRNV